MVRLLPEFFLLWTLALLGGCEGAVDGSLPKGDGIWRTLAERALRAEQGASGSINGNDLKSATEAVYMDYLRYLNDIGIAISKANFALEIEEKQQQLPPSDVVYCTAEQLREWESYSMSALDSGLAMFISTYCGRPCRNEADGYTTVMDPKSCVDEATELYVAYDCETDPRFEFAPRFFSAAVPLSGEYIWNDASGQKPLGDNGNPEYVPDNQTQIVLFPNDPTGYEYNPVIKDDLDGGYAEAPWVPKDESHSPNKPSELTPPHSVKQKVARKVAQCKKAAEEALITTYAPVNDIHNIDDHFDPAWISTPMEPPLVPDDPTLKDKIEASNCKTADDSSTQRLAKLRQEYESIRNERVMYYFAQYHIWGIAFDANDDLVFGPDKTIVSQIQGSADTFFLELLNSYDPLFGMRPCAEGADAEMSFTITKPGDKPEDEDEDPKKIITLDDLTASDSPFTAFVSRFISSFFNSLIFADSLGTADEAHPPLWNNILKGELSNEQLTEYATNLQARCPEGYAQFIHFLRLNEQHIMVDLMAGAATGFVGPGAVKAGEWTVAKTFSALSKVDKGFFSKLASSTAVAIEMSIGPTAGGRMASRLQFWKTQTTIAMENRAFQFSSGWKLNDHFVRHAKEWGPEMASKEVYLLRAQNFIKSFDTKNVLTHTSKEGYLFKYNQVTNEFAILTPDDVIMTFMKPRDELLYFLQQVKRYP